jgi:hypothetical protein
MNIKQPKATLLDRFYSNIEYFQEHLLGKKDIAEQLTVDSEQPNTALMRKFIGSGSVPVNCALLKSPQSSWKSWGRPVTSQSIRQKCTAPTILKKQQHQSLYLGNSVWL